jgi:hypothetical protein
MTTNLTERKLGWGFGLLGAALIIIAALISIVYSIGDMVAGRSMLATNYGAEALLLFVVGALALFFAYLGQKAWSDQPIVSGVLLVVIAAVGWGVLGFGANIIALIGTMFVLLAGVLYLIGPAIHSAQHATTA